MERNAFINGRNIWSTWGAELMDGALEAILTPPPVKDYIENDSRLEHGIQITSSPEICKMEVTENAGVSLWSNSKNPIRATGKILYEN